MKSSGMSNKRKLFAHNRSRIWRTNLLGRLFQTSTLKLTLRESRMKQAVMESKKPQNQSKSMRNKMRSMRNSMKCRMRMNSSMRNPLRETITQIYTKSTNLTWMMRELPNINIKKRHKDMSKMNRGKNKRMSGHSNPKLSSLCFNNKNLLSLRRPTHTYSLTWSIKKDSKTKKSTRSSTCRTSWSKI